MTNAVNLADAAPGIDGSGTNVSFAGTVGIGTSSPGSLLEVFGTSNGMARFTYSGARTWAVGNSSTNDGAFRIVDVSASAERLKIDTSGNLQFNSGYGSAAVAYGCRAWVNFNGTGTVAIRADGGVSSIGDNGTGDYTVNFDVAMPDANYSVVGIVNTASAGGESLNIFTAGANPTTTAARVQASRYTAAFDASYVCVAFFR